MFDQLVIDALDFVRSGKSLQGDVSLLNLKRLKGYLTNQTGKLAYLISGLLDERGRPLLKISVSGIVDLSCQRCLEKIEYMLDVKTALLLAKSEDELSRYDEDISVDAIYAPSELDVLALIEDEVILSLPISPRHEDTTRCRLSTGIHKTIPEEHPFTVLASLKRSH